MDRVLSAQSGPAATGVHGETRGDVFPRASTGADMAPPRDGQTAGMPPSRRSFLASAGTLAAGGGGGAAPSPLARLHLGRLHPRLRALQRAWRPRWTACRASSPRCARRGRSGGGLAHRGGNDLLRGLAADILVHPDHRAQLARIPRGTLNAGRCGCSNASTTRSPRAPRFSHPAAAFAARQLRVPTRHWRPAPKRMSRFKCGDDLAADGTPARDSARPTGRLRLRRL